MSNLLKATIRANLGKGAARKSRKAGLLPAVVYSKEADCLSVEVSPRDLTQILRRPLRRNALIELDVDGQGVRHVMIRDIQKHPVRRDLMHIDFLQVDPAKNVIVEIPIAMQGRAKAVVAGGKLEQVRRNVTVSCLPTKIPAHIDLDITNLKFGSTLAGDVALPEGLSLKDDPALPVITIRTARGKKEDTDEEATAEGGSAAATA